MSRLSRERKQKYIETRESLPPKQKLNFELKKIHPLTKNQKRVFDNRDQHSLLYGSAGTGKTFLCMYTALDDIIERNLFKKLIIIRSAQSAKAIGFLPGSEKEKLAVYESAYKEICTKLFGRGDAYEVLKQKGVIEFHSTSFLRGITLEDSVIIFDEFQNAGFQEISTVLTRLSDTSKLFLCGDVRQCDIKIRDERAGHRIFLEICKNLNINIVQFDEDDIVRSGFCKEWIIACNRYEEKNRIDLSSL